jgi:hypothetical protein
MSIAFLSPWILLGTLLVAVPIIIHLVMRRKPKLLIFPALQFLQQRRKTNLRKLRLRHLLLLLMRILLISLAALALARPLASNLPGQLAVGSPLAVVLIFDTSPSMEYKIEGKTRLDAAKEQAQSFLRSLPSGSEVAILDSAENVSGRFVSPGEAEKLVDNRRLQAHNRTVTTVLDEALKLIDRTQPKLPVLLCVFSDRTNASWDKNAVGTFLLPQKQTVEAKLQRPLNLVYYDLSAPEPRNLSITGISVRPASISAATPLEELRFGVPGREMLQMVAIVQSTNLGVKNEAWLYVDGKPEPISKVAVSFTGGTNQIETKTVVFPPMELKEPVLQGRIVLASPDALDGDNVRYWTLVAPQRRVLILADEPNDAEDWRDALETLRILPMSCDVKKPADVPTGLVPDDYQAVCLFSVKQPSQQLWEILQRYVQQGGGLVVLPGDRMTLSHYTAPVAQELLPGKPKAVKSLPAPGATLDVRDYEHPALGVFKRWQRDIEKGFNVTRFWELEAIPGVTNSIIPLNTAGSPILWAERNFDRTKVGGRVLWLGTLMYSHPEDPAWQNWNNFQSGWIYQGLAYACVSYVIGAREQRTNFLLGDQVQFYLPRTGKMQEYVLKGPASSSGKINAGQSTLALPEASRPGNYLVSDPTGAVWNRHFSVNLTPQETQLAGDRPNVDEIKRFFGAEGIAQAGDQRQLADLVRDALGMSPQSELLPYLMLLILILLAAENYLANRFYQMEPSEA